MRASMTREYQMIQYTPELVITNLDQLPRGTSAKYLECIIGPDGALIAKSWRNVKPEQALISYQPEVLVRFK